MKEAAVMLIIKDGLILAVSRKNDPNKYGLVGGKLDPGETPWVAAVRETLEETNLLVRHGSFLYRRDEESEVPGGESFHTYCYYATDWEGTPTSLEDIEVRWITAAELTGELGAFPAYNTNTLNKFRELYPNVTLK